MRRLLLLGLLLLTACGSVIPPPPEESRLCLPVLRFESQPGDCTLGPLTKENP